MSGYRGCYSVSGLPDNSVAIYESKSSMTVGFCVQVCQGFDPAFATSSFMGIQVRPNVDQHIKFLRSFNKTERWKKHCYTLTILIEFSFWLQSDTNFEFYINLNDFSFSIEQNIRYWTFFVFGQLEIVVTPILSIHKDIEWKTWMLFLN